MPTVVTSRDVSSVKRVSSVMAEARLLTLDVWLEHEAERPLRTGSWAQSNIRSLQPVQLTGYRNYAANHYKPSHERQLTSHSTRVPQ